MSLLYSESLLPSMGRHIAGALRPGDAIGLSGDLGAGKTSLARAILSGLGYTAEVPSPSFGVVQTYEPPEVRLPVWHIDLFRLSGPEEIADLGLDEARINNTLLIEWPDRLGQGWSDMLMLHIGGTGEERRLTADVPNSWKSRWTLT